MSENFTQDFYTSRRNYGDGDTRIGQKDRLWYDSKTNTIRISDGVTPGGIIVSATGSVVTDGSAGGIVSPGTIEILKNGTQITGSATSLNFIGEFELAGNDSGNVDISLISPVGTFDGGSPTTVYDETTPTLNAGGVT